MSHETPLPRSLASRSLRIIRPRDAADTYRNPQWQFSRLAKAGQLVRVAHGYYAVPPAEWLGDSSWRPTPETVALGIAIADYGPKDAVLSGISAARVLGIPPRAIAIGVVTAPVRRPAINTIAGPVEFWHRSSADLDYQKTRTELATGWSGTAEQALLDIADRPTLGGLLPTTATDALWELAKRADWTRVQQLSLEQRRRAAYARAVWTCFGLDVGHIPPPRPGRPVPTKGLVSWGQAEPSQFGLVP